MLGILLVSCSTQRSTVHEGRFQKRHHRPGWHVDLHQRSRSPSDQRTSEREQFEILDRKGPDQTPLPTAGPMFASNKSTLQETTTLRSDPGEELDTELTTVGDTITRAEIRQDQEEVVPKKWNQWAIPAFVLALGAVAYGILGTSQIILVLAVVLAIVVAAIALRKGRIWEWSGKGFAVTAMIIASFAALITLIALLNGGA